MSVALRVAAAKGGAPAPLHATVVVPAGPDGRAPASIPLHVALDGSEGSVPVPPGARPGDRLRVVVPTAYPNWGPAPRCAPAPLSASAPAHASVLPTPRLIVREPALLTGAARCAASTRATGWPSTRQAPTPPIGARGRRSASRRASSATPASYSGRARSTEESSRPARPTRASDGWPVSTLRARALHRPAPPPAQPTFRRLLIALLVPGALSRLHHLGRQCWPVWLARSASPTAPPAPFRSAHSALLLPERTAAAQTAAAREEQVPAAPAAPDGL